MVRACCSSDNCTGASTPLGVDGSYVGLGVVYNYVFIFKQIFTLFLKKDQGLALKHVRLF